MKKWAIYDDKGNWLFNVHAETEQLALNQASESDNSAVKAELVSDVDS